MADARSTGPPTRRRWRVVYFVLLGLTAAAILAVAATPSRAWTGIGKGDALVLTFLVLDGLLAAAAVRAVFRRTHFRLRRAPLADLAVGVALSLLSVVAIVVLLGFACLALTPANR